MATTSRRAATDCHLGFPSKTPFCFCGSRVPYKTRKALSSPRLLGIPMIGAGGRLLLSCDGVP